MKSFSWIRTLKIDRYNSKKESWELPGPKIKQMQISTSKCKTKMGRFTQGSHRTRNSRTALTHKEMTMESTLRKCKSSVLLVISRNALFFAQVYAEDLTIKSATKRFLTTNSKWPKMSKFSRSKCPSKNGKRKYKTNRSVQYVCLRTIRISWHVLNAGLKGNTDRRTKSLPKRKRKSKILITKKTNRMMSILFSNAQ